MKKTLNLSLLALLSVGLTATTFAAKKEAAAATPAPMAKPAATPTATKLAKPIPMYSRVDAVDAGAKTFTTKRKDGVEVKHKITATTEMKNGPAAATFADIKVGLYVSGLRLQKSATEYEVVKITKIAAKAEKKDEAKKPQ